MNEKSYGYAGKILSINLTTREITIIPTRKYADYYGGHGLGSAVFFDLCKDKTVDGFDPDNVCTLMSSPLSGTLAPSASGRTEVQGIGVQSYPIGWFTRSNFGGRFSPNLKYAGWDGVAIQGKADQPVWIDIRNDEVTIRNCKELGLWGMTTYDCQQTIWKYVGRTTEYGDWVSAKDDMRSTQRPAVVAIGPAGENLSRMACLIHDAGNGAGQGGFGGVWGSKNLKAISAIGTGAIAIHDPKGLMQTRMWIKDNYVYNPKEIKVAFGEFRLNSAPKALEAKPTKVPHRPQSCSGCIAGCRQRNAYGHGNEVNCRSSRFYTREASTEEIAYKAKDLMNGYGLNAYEIVGGLWYLIELHKKGVLGPGKEVDCPLDFDDLGSYEFAEQYVKILSYHDDGKGNPHPFGEDLADGFYRAAMKWGRVEQDMNAGILLYPYWGLPEHSYDGRSQLEWAYSTILGDREMNEHDYVTLFFDYLYMHHFKIPLPASVEEMVKIYTDKMEPFEGDMRMLDYSTENMYSVHIAKMIAWNRYYSRFWKQTLLMCDWRWPDFLNKYAADKRGCTGEAEPRILKAVTGIDISFAEGMEVGRKIWNLDQAIWTLQGRHRDMVKFSNYIHDQKYKPDPRIYGLKDYPLTSYVNGEWKFADVSNRTIERDKFEEFKTRFYELQGWDPASGYPTRSTLASLGLEYVAEELEANGKLGKEQADAA